jgi:hypothetical protein
MSQIEHDLESLSKYFHEIVDSKESTEWVALIKECYLQFEVMDSEGNWTFTPLKEFEQELLSSTEDVKIQIGQLITDVVSGIRENQYHSSFVTIFKQSNLDIKSSILRLEDESQGKRLHHLEYLLGFAYTLEKFNLVLQKDWRLLEQVVSHYQKLRFKQGYYRLSNLLGMSKLHSIQKPVVNFIKAKKKGSMGPSFGKFFLSLNIFEAALVDLCTGFWSNAYSAFVMIFFSPNYKGFFGLIKSFSHGKESRVSTSGQTLEMYSPGAKKWADLYQVWNMAFIAQFPQAPYLLVKLLVPSVSRYKDCPEQYMHKRITALLLALNYLDFCVKRPKIKSNVLEIKSTLKAFVSLWGKVNKKCSKDYMLSIKN